jgi:aspartate kinase
MKVFKFGGASVRNAEAVKNVARILRSQRDEKIVVVISAMGKMTNKLEQIHQSWRKGEDVDDQIKEFRQFHLDIIRDLHGNNSSEAASLNAYMTELGMILDKGPSPEFDFDYDQIVSFGELISTRIVHSWLVREDLPTEWVDVRHVIKTDNKHRAANVDWNKSETSASILKDHLEKEGTDIIVTQGFIGSSKLGNTTTLGREGSDFSAAIIAFLTNATSVTIWKDVPAMLNADPKWFNNTIVLEKISYREAIELSYYGASVIHPKTIKPLQNKRIPLFVKSFNDPEASGTIIQEQMDFDHRVPSYIFKPDQLLISISPKDFSFIVEENLRDLFDTFAFLGIHINLMQNSAINFSICIDRDQAVLEKLKSLLSNTYEVRYNEDLELLTIRHYNKNTVSQLTANKEILMEQKTRQTMRLVLRDLSNED